MTVRRARKIACLLPTIKAGFPATNRGLLLQACAAPQGKPEPRPYCESAQAGAGKLKLGRETTVRQRSIRQRAWDAVEGVADRSGKLKQGKSSLRAEPLISP
jgi:hypothetical protein